jgi:hypothetical protein
LIVDLLSELLLAIVGDVLGGSLLSRDTATPQPPEGEWNASSGSLAAFLAGLGALFGGIAVIVMHRGPSDVPLALFFAIGLFSTAAATILARRSFHVTSRRRGLAKGALWAARGTMAVLAFSAFELLLRVL